MSDENLKKSVFEVIKTVQDPELKRDIVSLGMLKGLDCKDGLVSVQIELTTTSPALKQHFDQEINQKLKAVNGIQSLEIHYSKAQNKNVSASPIKGISHVVAVASGKGGVGKSTVSVNLALALAKEGYRVGLMDGDIYGPNIPLMLGVSHDQKPHVTAEEKLEPIAVKGIKMISMGVLVPPDQPMVWRGPMLHSAVTQFVQKVDWGELDYLLVDLPPGTGDVQLSLVQSVPLSGAVIVTTPQEVALMDVRKGIAMFNKTNVPILGVVENMTGEIFGRGGGQKAAEECNAPFLGDIPLDGNVRVGGDSGEPVVLSEPDSEASKGFVKAAKSVAQKLTLTSNAV